VRIGGEAVEQVGGGAYGGGVGAEGAVEQVSDLSEAIRHGECS